MDKFVCKLSFWSALVVALLVVLIGVGLVWSAVVFPMTAITSIEAYQLSFTGWQMLPLLPALILAPMFVVLMLCVHEYAPSDRKILGKVSSAFAIVSASVLSIHYYTQLTIVRQGLPNNQTAGLWLFSAPNPYSFFWSFAALGYGFMGLALFVAAPIFKEKAENNIRLLFAANGAVGIGMFVGNALGIFIANIRASFIWGVLFPVATLLVAGRFYNREID